MEKTEKEILSSLNSEQISAVTHENGPALVVAGAGTGKTTVITKRFEWLVSVKKVAPESILALTFTDKSSFEMEERVDRLLPYGHVNLWIHTFHKFCERILRSFASEIGLSVDFRLLSATEQWMLIRNNLDRLKLDYYKPLSNPTKFIELLIKHFSRCKDENILPDKYLEWVESLRLDADAKDLFEVGDHYEKLSAEEKKSLTASFVKRYSEIAESYHSYQQLLLENNYLDFGDLIQYTLKLFKASPYVMSQLRNKFKYILVDEFQDTNTAQYDLVKILAYPNNNIMVVGDDDQSIYRFRGASIQNIMQFKEDYNDAKEVVLKKNYRSGQAILDIAYRSIVHNNPDRLEIKLGIDKHLSAINSNPGLVEHIHALTYIDEIEKIGQKILELKASDKELMWSDFAVLIRANSSSAAIVSAFERMHIPNECLSSKGLYTKPAIIDLISYFKVLYNHHDDSAFYRVLNISSFEVSCDDIVCLVEFTHKKGLSFYSSFEQLALVPGLTSKGALRIGQIFNLIHKHSALLQDKRLISEIFVSFLHDSLYLDSLTKVETVDNYYSLNQLDQFHKKIKRFEEDQPQSGISGFLETLALEFESGETGSLNNDAGFMEDKVQILTIHASKGLEFPYVFIVHMVDRKFPVDHRDESISIPRALLPMQLISKDHHIQEERRLFYVALTRAKKGLFLTSAESYGGVKKKKPSIFIGELGFSFKALINSTKSEKGENISDEHENGSHKIFPKISNNNSESNSQQRPSYLLPKSFSYTELVDFETCPYMYKLRYILKIATRGNKNISFGSTLHRTIESFTKQVINSTSNKQADLFNLRSQSDSLIKNIPSFDELITIYEKSWIDNWYESQQEQKLFKDLGKKILGDFHTKFVAESPQCYLVEQSFIMPFGDYTLRGRVDRIDKKADGTLSIIDYKSGTPKKRLTKEDKRQLILYYLAVEHILKMPISELTYYYLKDGSTLSFIVNDKDRNDFVAWINDVISRITVTDFSAISGKHCNLCSFNSICDAKSL